MFYIITKALEVGTMVMVPILVIVSIFKIDLRQINQRTLVESVNIVVLITSLLHFLSFLILFIPIFFAPGEYEQYTLSTRITGSVGIVINGVSFIGYFVFPQIFWFRKIRKSLYAAVLIFLVWVGIMLIEAIEVMRQEWRMEYKYDATEILIRVLIYIIVITGVYLIISRKRITSRSSSTL
jgi:hypothetical protein